MTDVETYETVGGVERAIKGIRALGLEGHVTLYGSWTTPQGVEVETPMKVTTETFRKTHGENLHVYDGEDTDDFTSVSPASAEDAKKAAAKSLGCDPEDIPDDLVQESDDAWAVAKVEDLNSE